jgi:hypothetical protein
VLLLSGCLEADVRHLSSDAMAGRRSLTAGSLLAQDHILTYLEAWTSGLDPTATGRDAYRQRFPEGTNLLGVIPGTDLAGEYVVVGAHYDGLGSPCWAPRTDDKICNGATDNATGAAIVLDIARLLHVSGSAPRRSVVVAFWDSEEDGIAGSEHFVQHPLVPLDDVVAYINLDIQGANLRPSGRNLTFAIGAESGGAVLSEAMADAAAQGPLDTRMLSMIFGEDRSDHAPFKRSGVPSVFLSDGTGPCYHTSADEVDVVDFTKLRAQADTARRLVLDLASGDDRPTFTEGLPLATFADAVSIADLLARVIVDLDTFILTDRGIITRAKRDVDAIVAAGPEAFDGTAILTLLVSALDAMDAVGTSPGVTTGTCDGYLAPTG